MIERLLIPSWNAPPRSVDDWRERFTQLGCPPTILQDDPEELWLRLDPVGVRLLAVVEGSTLVALHAEIDPKDPASAISLLEDAALGLSWEVHDEGDDDEDGDDGS